MITKRVFILFGFSAFLLLCALSTAGQIFWLLFWLLFMMLLFGAISSFWANATLSFDCQLSKNRVTRGETVLMDISLSYRCPLPVAPIQLNAGLPHDIGSFSLHVHARPFADNAIQHELSCPHVGEYPAGVTSARVRDVFGLFSWQRQVPGANGRLSVLPRIHLAEPLAFSPGDADTESISRAFEDATLPTDVRAYQQGDELKKVHWKLSMRKRELLVRVYEQPARPDALILVDCAPPVSINGDEMPVRDAICEAAASLASLLLKDSAPVRLPLLDEVSVDINAQKPEDLPMVLDALSRCVFRGTQQFERVLLLETRRMRRTGSTAIVTSRMNPVIADMILRIRRIGPKVRVMLAADMESDSIQLLTNRLIRNDVEVVEVKVE